MNKVDHVLTAVLLTKYCPGTSEDWKEQARPRLGRLVERAVEAEPHPFRERLRRRVRSIRDDIIPRAPPDVLAWLERAILLPALLQWATAVVGPPQAEIDSGAFEQRVRAWFDGLPAADQAIVFGTAIRHEIGLEIGIDREPREQLTEALVPSKENSMATYQFIFDTRGLPTSLKIPAAQQAWELAVDNQIANLGLPKNATDPKTSATYAAIKGMLLLDEQFDPTTSEFAPAVQRVWLETLGTTVDVSGVAVLNRDVYPSIADIIAANTDAAATASAGGGGGTSTPKLLYQQFASVARYVITNAPEVPFGSPLFASQVRLGMDRYVAGPPPADSLDIPALTGAAVQDAELDGQNMLAFSTIYAIAQLDEMKAFYTVDRLTEDFLNGTLATQFDAGGKLLDTWFWTRRDRMTESDRRSVFSRMLGMPGGDVAKDIQPNTEFNDRFLGFLSAVSEFDRQQRISDLFTGTLAGNRAGSLAMTMENVRQKGHDLAANMSLYGYGYAHFAARRLNADFSQVMTVLKHPVIQKLLGVTSPYQVIERKCIADFGKAPDIVRLRTMADAGKRVLDIIGRNATAWSSATSVPLFPDLNAVQMARQAAASGSTYANPNAAGGPSAISVTDTEELIRQTSFFLAANGVQYEDVDRQARPKLNAYEPSLPMLSGMTPSAGHVNGAASAMDKIKQMVSSGQTPTLDQLKAVLPGGFSA